MIAFKLKQNQSFFFIKNCLLRSTGFLSSHMGYGFLLKHLNNLQSKLLKLRVIWPVMYMFKDHVTFLCIDYYLIDTSVQINKDTKMTLN